MKLTAETTVRDAARLPRAARLFELVGIDYCCADGASLRDASAAAGIAIDEVLDLIGGDGQAPESGPEENWLEADLSMVTRHIVERYHRGARRQLLDLLEAVSQAASGHAGKRPELWQIKDAVEHLARELVPHMNREERFLFPYIASMGSPVGAADNVRIPLFGTVEYPLQSIRHDHSEDLALLGRIRNAARALAGADGACDHLRNLATMLARFDRDLTRHIELENDVLFPRAIAMEKTIARGNTT